jgi:hypothetical protein
MTIMQMLYSYAENYQRAKWSCCRKGIGRQRRGLGKLGGKCSFWGTSIFHPENGGGERDNYVIL